VSGRRPSLASATRAVRLVGTRLVAVMRDYVIYLDDSGTDPAQPVVVVAGYLSTDREWKKFSKAWLAVLARYRLPYFHMTEFMTTWGTKLFPKRAWPDERKNRLIDELLAVIGRGAMCQLGVGTPKAEWEAVLTPAIKRHLGSPFTIGLHLCLRDALRWLPRHLSKERVGVIFDQAPRRAQNQLLRAYALERELQRLDGDHRLGPLAFDDKRQCPPLQAADIPALLYYQALRDKDEQQGRIREVFARLMHRLGKRNVLMRYSNEESLRKSVVEMEEAIQNAASASGAPASLRRPSGQR